MPNPNPPARRRARETLPHGIRMRRERDPRTGLMVPTGLMELRVELPNGTKRSDYSRDLEELLALQAQAPAARPELWDARITVADWIRVHFLPHLTLKHATVRAYTETLERYVIPTLGPRIRLVDLTRADVRTMLATIHAERGLAHSTMGHIRTALSAALAAAVEEGRLTENPARGVKLPTREDRRRVKTDRAIPDAAAIGLLFGSERVRSHRWYPILVMAWITGARQAELLGLRWSDLTPGYTHVHLAGSLTRHARELDTAKARSERTLAVPELGRQALTEWRKRQVAEQLERGWRDEDSGGLVFTMPTGRMVYGASLTQWLKHEFALLGLPAFHWYALRHSVATAIIERTGDIFRASRILGHSTIATTANVYGHLTESMSEESAELLAGMVGTGTVRSRP
jgi:integrase